MKTMKLSIVCLLIVLACAMATATPQQEETKRSETQGMVAKAEEWFNSMMKGGKVAYDKMANMFKSWMHRGANEAKGTADETKKVK